LGQAGIVTSSLLEVQGENAVKERVAALEARTGVEAVCAVITRADSYPEIPWKAFALGASLAALATVAAALFAPGWEAFEAIAKAATAILAAGGTAAIATVWISPFARIFLQRSRGQGEVLQYAQALFLESGMFKTSRRDGILLLVSLFERQVVVIADSGIRDRIESVELDSVVAAVTARLAQRLLTDALLDGLARLEEILRARGFQARAGVENEISDTVIQRGTT